MPDPQPSRGFWDELRGQGCLVKGAVVLGVFVVGSPVIFIVLGAIGEAFGFGAAVIAGLALLAMAIWFLGSSPAGAATAPADIPAGWDITHDPWRYCGHCGASFGLTTFACPECDTPWVAGTGAASPGFLAGALNDLTARFLDGSLERESFFALRAFYERRLVALRQPVPAPETEPEAEREPEPEPEPGPAVHVPLAETLLREEAAPEPEPEPVPVAAISVDEESEYPPPIDRTPPEPAEPVTPFGEVVVAWAAERQADILLYLGAFLVSVAAMTFVSYQGAAVSPLGRVGILGVYTVCFLALGILLHHWERAREAGPIFLALGAILVPIDFVAALRVDVFEDQGGLPKDVLWLLGSLGLTALYSILAWRGYGRYYLAPVVPSLLIAWGSLAFVLNVPEQWLGAWFELAAAAVYVEASRDRLPMAPWIRWGGITLGLGGLVYATAAAFEDVHQWQLSATFAIAALALLAAMRFRRSVLGLSVLPIVSAVAAGAAAWAARDPDPAWYTWYVAAAGWGYLLIAHFDRHGRTDDWRLAALAPWGLAVVVAVSTAFDGGSPGPLAATLSVIAAGSAGGVARWRLQWRPGLALLPAIMAAAGGTIAASWFDMRPEWSAPWIAAAAAGYLAIAHYDLGFRPRWQATALASGLLAVASAAIVATLAERGSADEFVLPATLGIVLAGNVAGIARWRLAWRTGLAALPSLLPATLGTFAWAAFEMPAEWAPAWIAAAAVGYLVVAEFDFEFRAAWQVTAATFAGAAIAAAIPATIDEQLETRHEFVQPVTLAILTLGTAAGVARWRLAWRAGLAALPSLLPATLGTFAWAAFEMPAEWAPAWIAVAAIGYLLPAEFDRQLREGWQITAVTLGMAAVAGAILAAMDTGRTPEQEFVLPATLAVLTLGTAAGVARWRLQWPTGVAALPSLVPAALGTLAFSWFEMPGEWAPAWIAVAAAGYLLPAEFDRANRESWQTAGLAFGFVAALGALLVAADGPEGIQREFVLPATLAILTLAASAGVARWRLSWRPGVAIVPSVAPATVASLAWAWLEMPIDWVPAWAAVAAVGYLLPAVFDARLRESWRTTTLALAAGAVSNAVLVAVYAGHDSPEGYVLPATLAIAAAGIAVGVALWRLNWRPGVGALPSLVPAAFGTLAWAGLEMSAHWAPCWIAAAGAGYLVPAIFDATYRRGWQWAAMSGGAVAVIGAIGAIVDVDRDSAREFILPVTLGILVAGNAAGVWLWRLGWREGVLTLPPLASGAVATLLWAAIDMSPVWAGAWMAVAAAGYVVPSYFDAAGYRDWRILAYAFGGAALLAAHSGVAPDLPDPAQLPITYALLLGAVVADAALRRDWSLLLPPVLTGALGATSLWAAGVEPAWWAFPSIGVAIALAATERLWSRGEFSRVAGWSNALALSAVPTLLSVVAYEDAPGQGMAAFALTSALLAAAALRSTGAIVRAVERFTELSTGSPGVAIDSERATLWYTAAAFALAACGYFNAVVGIADADRAWPFLALGSVAWLAAAGFGRRLAVAPFFAVPPALVASSLAAGLAAPSPAIATMVLALAAVMPAVAFAATRFPPFWLASSVYASLAIWSFWTWAEFPPWTLSGAYAASAVTIWLALFGVRRYGRFEMMRDSTVHAISWAPWVLASATAWILLSDRSTGLETGEKLVRTPEWASAVSILAGGSAAITAEGWRLHNRYVQQAGTLGLLVSLLLTIAIGDPTSVQAYAAPVGLYIVGTGLTIPRSDQLFGRHMDLHEGLIVVGTLFIVLPPAQQGFNPGGEIYGFELMGIGLLFLFAGLILHARWLVPAGVLTITGVAVRWLTGGFVDVPFWLMLGAVGTFLLAVGTFILLQRERWDSWRTTARLWWLRTTAGVDSSEAPAA